MERTKTYVGIDIGKLTRAACIMGADGGVLKRAKYPDTRNDEDMFIDSLAEYDCVAACESTARMWIRTYEEFEGCGMSITLANPHRLKMAQSGVKTDRIDGMFTWNIWHRKSMFSFDTPANTFMRTCIPDPDMAGLAVSLNLWHGLAGVWPSTLRRVHDSG